MPLLELRSNNFDYNKEVVPFIKNGIIIDTCVVKTLIDGFIATRISKKPSSLMPDFELVLAFLERIKLNNKWDKFLVTPQIVSEVFNHFRDDGYYKGGQYKQILEEVMPLIKSMGEKFAEKNEVLKYIDHVNPIIEMGDFSIFVVADDYCSRGEKVSVLSDDSEVTSRYMDNPKVLGMDYRTNMLNYN
ncbi:MAG: hypothetical protein AAB913_01425 [Patescibacteria group bacterium]